MRSITQLGALPLWLLVSLIPYSMVSGVVFNKYVAYFFVCVMTAISLSFYRKSMMQVLVVLVFLVLIENVFIYKNYIAEIIPVGVGILFVCASYFTNLKSVDHDLKTRMNIKVLTIILLLSALLSTAMSILGSDVPLEEEIKSFLIYIGWGLIFFLYGLQIRKLPYFSQIEIERIFSTVTICVSFLHILAVTTGTNIESVRVDGVASVIDAGKYFRYGGVFGNINVQSAFVLGGMCYGMFLYVRKESKLDKLLGSFAFIIGLVSVAISGSRMAWLDTILLVIMFIIYKRKNLKEISHFLIGISIFSVVFIVFAGSKVIKYFQYSVERIGSKGSDTDRLDIWICTINQVPENLFGMGINPHAFLVNMKSCMGIGSAPANSHNLMLDFVVHLGIPGLFLFIFCSFILFKYVLKTIISGKKGENVSNIFTLMVIYIFGLSEAFVFGLNKLHLVCFFIIGITVSVGSNARLRRIRRSLISSE